MSKTTLLLAFVLGVLTPIGAFAQTILYVDEEATGSETGTSWEEAYTSLQDALERAEESSGEVEIWVASGTYLPSSRAEESDPRSTTFQLTDEVELYGGFDGEESSRDERDPDPTSNGTVLSGDIGSRDFQGDNAYHVVTGSTTTSVVLDGFTIIGGNADGSGNKEGGGLFLEEGRIVLRNCLFKGNSAAWDGGAIHNYRSRLRVTHCTFRNNTAGFQGGSIRNTFAGPVSIENTSFIENEAEYGGGAVSNLSSSPRVVDSDFLGNGSGLTGGAMDNASNSNPTILQSRFAGNRSDYLGGALYNRESSPTLASVLLTGNRAEKGGSVYNESSSPTLVNVTLSGSLADDGFGGGDGGALYSDDQSGARLRNTIVWNNAARGSGNEVFIASGPVKPSFSHSLVEGGLPPDAEDEGGNADRDPEFEAPIDPENAPTPEGNFRILTDGAPVLDRGDPSHLPPDSLDLDDDGDTAEPLPHDVAGEDRIVDNTGDGTPVVDIGAYEAPSSVIPVELVALRATATEEGALLTWQTASETNNAGFDVERRTDVEEDTSWTKVQFVDGQGTTSRPQTYRFEDASLPYGAEAAEYRLRQIDTDGSFELSRVVTVELRPPSEIVLHDNVPNPFRSETTIRFELPEKRPVTISLYNALGQRVKQIIDRRALAGRNEVRLEAKGLTSGVYFVHLQTPQRHLSQKVTVIR